MSAVGIAEDRNAWVPPELAAMRGAGGVEPIWLPNPWKGGRVLMLGCGAKPMVGAVNHDRVIHSPWVDVAWDLDVMPWDAVRSAGPFDAVYGYDLWEHLKDAYGAINEVHALLNPGGILIFRMASWDNPVSYRDLTHCHYAHEESFDFFDRSTAIGSHYSSFHPVDSLGRLPTHWKLDGVDRVNADRRCGVGDLQFTMVKVDA